ncbi:YbhN family protein [Erythrobacter sp. W302b]|uniref:lysylphosphatidylglycerol synthase transmembrane domain-containing protein n=1 Tax=Erythrobacter sp. W302b TaxID=3389874 RepID=UPI00396B2EF7
MWSLPVVALGNVAVLIWSLGTINLAERLVAPPLLALAGLLVFVPMVANALRLMISSRFLGLGLGLVGALRVTTGTMVANSVTPSAAGGAPIKALFLIGEGIEPRRAVSLISFQAAEDAVSLFGLAAVAAALSGFAFADLLPPDPDLTLGIENSLRIGAGIMVGLVAVLMALGGVIGAGVLGHRIRGSLCKLLRRVRVSLAIVTSDWGKLMRRGKGVAILNLGIACVQWSVRFSIAGLVLRAFGIAWQPALFWLLQYLIQTISSIVPSPGGVGGAEAGFLLLFAPFVEHAVLLPAMSTWRLLFFYLPLMAAALIYFVLRHRQRAAAPSLHGHMPAE